MIMEKNRKEDSETTVRNQEGSPVHTVTTSNLILSFIYLSVSWETRATGSQKQFAKMCTRHFFPSPKPLFFPPRSTDSSAPSLEPRCTYSHLSMPQKAGKSASRPQPALTVPGRQIFSPTPHPPCFREAAKQLPTHWN